MSPAAATETTGFFRGALYWAHLDKRRPVIVISHDLRNRLANDVTVIPCSTRLRPMVWHVLLHAGEGGLPATSTAKCEQVTTLPKSELEPSPLGPPLSTSRLQEIERALQLALGIDLS